jgi:putative NIF3 family GTP cyclohydrolase 1 type 2
LLGLQGEEAAPVDTLDLLVRADPHARTHGQAATGVIPPGHITRRWALLTGARAMPGPGVIEAARSAGADTLITGEGDHHAPLDSGIAVICGGHYASEVFGVRALRQVLHATFGLRAVFLDLPQGPLTLSASRQRTLRVEALTTASPASQ